MYNPNNKLFHIQQQYVQLLGKIEDADGEITPEIDSALQFTEQRLRQEGADVAYAIKTLEYWQEDLKKEIERLDKMKARALKSSELFRARLKTAMEQFGIERISDPYITISFRKSEAVEITEETLIPDDYKELPPPKISKTKIKEALKSGTDVPGAAIVQRNNLIIK